MYLDLRMFINNNNYKFHLYSAFPELKALYNQNINTKKQGNTRNNAVNISNIMVSESNA